MSEIDSIEQWRDIPGYPGYKVSSLGQVMSFRAIGCRARNENVANGRLMKPRVNRCGHFRVGLCRDGVPHDMFVHVAVLLAFVGPCPDGMESCHENDIKSDNSLDNLSWGTQKKNRADADRNGRSKIGEGHANAKITETDVREIRRLAETQSQQSIADRFGICQTVVGRIVRRVDWKHVV